MSSNLSRWDLHSGPGGHGHFSHCSDAQGDQFEDAENEMRAPRTLRVQRREWKNV